MFALLGSTVSFENNFIASDIGCNTPATPTVVGPNLNCIDANTFLSNSVNQAIPINIGITILKILLIPPIRGIKFISFIILFFLFP
jgi:hypothetical protein